MKYSRRDFGLLLPALAASCLRAQDSSERLCSKRFPFEELALGQDTAAPLCAENVQELELDIRDYATMPMTGAVNGKGDVKGLLARVNFMREEPRGRGKKRFFVNDLNGPLYILDKVGRKFTTYLNFNGRDGQPGLFHKLPTDDGLANGFISFVFDPDYGRNGKFYTIHLEDPKAPGSAMPDNTHFPGVDTSGYELTPAIQTPGPTIREAVLLEWTDTHTQDATFEGTVRELMRLRQNTRIHPMADVIFNATARPGDPDWRVLYIACGDGGSGESSNPQVRSNPGSVLRLRCC